MRYPKTTCPTPLPGLAPHNTAFSACVCGKDEKQLRAVEDARKQRAVEDARKQRGIERQLGVRNPTANGAAAIMLRAAARVEGDVECGILSAQCNNAARSMRCCGNLVCAACLCEWLTRNGQPTDVGYGDYRGRRIIKPMHTHRCPWCAATAQSVRRALV